MTSSNDRLDQIEALLAATVQITRSNAMAIVANRADIAANRADIAATNVAIALHSRLRSMGWCKLLLSLAPGARRG